MSNAEPNSPAPTAAEHKVEVLELPRVAEGWERIFPVFIHRTDTEWRVQIHWRRLGISLVILTGLLWMGAATSLFCFFKYQRGFTEVRFADIVLLPARWHQVQTARGDFYIKTAQKQLAEGKVREAIYSLQSGIAKSPANRDGRILLAQCYASPNLMRQPDAAEKLLVEGLPFHRDDLEYLKTLFIFLLDHQKDTEVIGLSRSLLPRNPPLDQRTQFLAFVAAAASFFRGNYDQAEDLIRTYQLGNKQEGQLLSARMEWERGFHDEAMTRLHELQKALPDDDEVYAQIITYLRESGRDDEARRESLFRQLGHPGNFRPRIDLLFANKKDGDEAAVQAGAKSILRDFAKDDKALLALADFAANTGDTLLARSVYEHCKANGLNGDSAALMIVEAHVVAKQYQAALDMVHTLSDENPEWGKRYYSVFNGLQAIASYGLGDPESGSLFLANFLGQNSLRADNLVAVANRLVGVGARREAQTALTQVMKTDPHNQAALTRLVKLDGELSDADALARDIQRLIVMRKPDHEVVENAYQKLGSDLFLLLPGRTALLQQVRTALDNLPTHS